jgi:hypothetical protein
MHPHKTWTECRFIRKKAEDINAMSMPVLVLFRSPESRFRQFVLKAVSPARHYGSQEIRFTHSKSEQHPNAIRRLLPPWFLRDCREIQLPEKKAVTI